MRISLFLGRFEYGERGILDITHKRLFTFSTLRRSMRAAGFDIRRVEGVIVPIPFVLGQSALSKMLLVVNRWLTKIWPSLFGFQILMVASPRPTLAAILEAASRAANQKSTELQQRAQRQSA